MPSPIDPTNPPETHADLEVLGAFPVALSGRLVGIGREGLVHSFHMHKGDVSYLARRVRMGVVITDVVAFDGSILAYGDDSSVHQVSIDGRIARRVDLAGHKRTVGACPRYDQASGELHLVAQDRGGAQAHVVVPAGALTRRSRSIVDTHERIQGLAIGRDHVVFVADGRVGVAPRSGEAHPTWIRTDIAAPWLVHTQRAGQAIVLLTLTPSLERWILHPESGAIEREVLDPTPRRFAHLGENGVDGVQRWVWTSGNVTICRHDLVDPGHAPNMLRLRVPGDFVVVPDATRPDGIEGGWLVVLVHEPNGAMTDLRVFDAADIAGPVIATVRIPRPIPQGFRCTWIPSAQR